MALIKEIELPNGVTVNYHRIVSINNVINQTSIIEVKSYTSKQKRIDELQYLANTDVNKPDMEVYAERDDVSIPYDKDLNIDSAYAYLKTTEKYSNSEDDDQNKKEC